MTNNPTAIDALYRAEYVKNVPDSPHSATCFVSPHSIGNPTHGMAKPPPEEEDNDLASFIVDDLTTITPLSVLEMFKDSPHVRRLTNSTFPYKPFTHMDKVMVAAASAGNAHLMRIAHDRWGATYRNSAMIQAAGQGQAECMCICHDEWGATDVSKAMEYAEAGLHDDCMRVCVSCGFTTRPHSAQYSCL